MPTPLLIGFKEKEALDLLRQLAAEHPVDMLAVMERVKTPDGKAAHLRRMTRQTIEIPFGFMVTFSIETNHPCGTCRHMSMSSPREGRLPTPEALRMIMVQLGFVSDLEQCTVWKEDLEGHGEAINVVEPVGMTRVETSEPQ